MKKLTSSLALLLLVLSLAGCGSNKKKDTKPEAGLGDQLTQLPRDAASVQSFVADWPEESRQAAERMLQKYGAPTEVTGSSLTWRDNRPFRETIVRREGPTHLFPLQHTEVLEQSIDYLVPARRVMDLHSFNGSIIIDRTKGTVTTRSHREELNVLNFNLMNEIVLGRLSPRDARQELSNYAASLEDGQVNQYMTTLHFMQMKNTADPDRALLAPRIEVQAQDAVAE
jgi:hypothetical protein